MRRPIVQAESIETIYSKFPRLIRYSKDLMNAVKIFYCRQSVEIKADSTIREPFNEAHTFLYANGRTVLNEIIILPPIYC